MLSDLMKNTMWAGVIMAVNQRVQINPISRIDIYFVSKYGQIKAAKQSDIGAPLGPRCRARVQNEWLFIGYRFSSLKFDNHPYGPDIRARARVPISVARGDYLNTV